MSARADEREPRERCAVCGQHCVVRWFRRFPGAEEDYAAQLGPLAELRRDWIPERPEARP